MKAYQLKEVVRILGVKVSDKRKITSLMQGIRNYALGVKEVVGVGIEGLTGIKEGVSRLEDAIAYAVNAGADKDFICLLRKQVRVLKRLSAMTVKMEAFKAPWAIHRGVATVNEVEYSFVCYGGAPAPILRCQKVDPCFSARLPEAVQQTLKQMAIPCFLRKWEENRENLLSISA